LRSQAHETQGGNVKQTKVQKESYTTSNPPEHPDRIKVGRLVAFSDLTSQDYLLNSNTRDPVCNAYSRSTQLDTVSMKPRISGFSILS